MQCHNAAAATNLREHSHRIRPAKGPSSGSKAATSGHLAYLAMTGSSPLHVPVPPGATPLPSTPTPKRHPYDQWAPDARALDLVGDKWTLLIIRDLSPGPRRFVELQRVLPGISTEQWRSRLNRMVADGLLTRQRYREVPPRVDYELTERSRELMPVLGALARWGYDWTWTAPKQGEDVNVGAIFRLAPGLAAPPADVRGTVDLVVQAAGQEDRVFRLEAADGRVAIRERIDGPADATVVGSHEAWIAALGPDGTTGGLAFDGDRPLAEGLLSVFAGAASGATRGAQ